MQQEASYIGEGRIAVRVASRSFSVVLGDSVSVPLVLKNIGSSDDFFEVGTRGIPAAWVSTPPPVAWLDPEEEQSVDLIIGVPPAPQAQPGSYPLVIRVTSQEDPEQTIGVPCTLTVEAVDQFPPAEQAASAGPLPGASAEQGIGVHLASLEYSVAPGGSTTIPCILVNNRLQDDVLTLSVDGIPSTWVSTPGPAITVPGGQQRQISITVQPPRASGSRAGRHSARILVQSRNAPGQMPSAGCVLTVGAFAEFGTVLHPEWVEAGQPTHVTVENHGNIQNAFTVTCQSPNDALTFEPGPRQSLRARPGGASRAEFRTWPRQRPLFGGKRHYPFTVQVHSSTRETQSLRGEVISRGLVPTWLLAAVAVFVLACSCAVFALMLTQGGFLEGEGQGTPAPAVTIDAEQPGPSLTQEPEEGTQSSPEQPATLPAATATPGDGVIEVPTGHSPEEPVEIQPEP